MDMIKEIRTRQKMLKIALLTVLKNGRNAEINVGGLEKTISKRNKSLFSDACYVFDNIPGHTMRNERSLTGHCQKEDALVSPAVNLSVKKSKF